jgi:hypothetical protein
VADAREPGVRGDDPGEGKCPCAGSSRTASTIPNAATGSAGVSGSRRERFRAFAENHGLDPDSEQEGSPPIADQRDRQLGEITRFASDPMSGLILGAKKKEIGREEGCVSCAGAPRWECFND